MSRRPIFKTDAATDMGSVRKNNEDNFKYLAEGESFWAAVADGCGGEAAGEVASQMALDVFAEHFSNHRNGGRDVAFVLRDSVVEANRRIVEAAREPGKDGMGTTLSGIYFSGDTAITFHIGDSRIYLRRDGEFRLLTEDHTWVADQVKHGRLKPEEAEKHPRASWLLKALGMPGFKTPDIDYQAVKVGDLFFLTSDGLLRCVKEEEIVAELSRGVEGVAQRLIALAKERGAPDNVTIVTIEVTGFEEG